MHFPVSIGSLLAFSSLYSTSIALPLISSLHLRALRPEPVLVPRAAYSVVPVDGGAAAAAAAGAGGSPVTVTIVQTVVGPTEIITIVETQGAPSATEIVTATTTLSGPERIETVHVTVVPPPTATDVRPAALSIVYVPTTVYQPVAAPTAAPSEPPLTANASFGTTSTSINGWPASTPITSLIATGSSDFLTSTTSAIPTTETTASTISTTGSETASSASLSPTTATTAYDDGMWHTSYPWSNSTSPTHGARRL